MKYLFFLLKRFLFPKESKLLSFALWVSVGGVALGVILLVIVLGVMSGFQNFLVGHYTEITSDLVVIPRMGRIQQQDLPELLRTASKVKAISPFAMGAAMVIKGGVAGVVVEGIEFDTAKEVTQWKKVFVDTPLWQEQQTNPYWIWIGKQLADKLKIKKGDMVDVMVADGEARQIIPFKVTAITKFGIYEHDMKQVRVDLGTLYRVFKQGNLSDSMFKVKLESNSEVGEVTASLREKLGTDAMVKPWYELHKNIFAAVKHQKQMLFFILQIIVALAAVNVVNLLLMNSHHRRRDVAILRAMGIPLKELFILFLIQGSLVGFIGIGLGIFLGKLACVLIERWQPALLSESIYNVTKLPIQIEWSDLGMIAGFAFLVCLLFSIIPSLKGALARPMEVLRYE